MLKQFTLLLSAVLVTGNMLMYPQLSGGSGLVVSVRVGPHAQLLQMRIDFTTSDSFLYSERDCPAYVQCLEGAGVHPGPVVEPVELDNGVTVDVEFHIYTLSMNAAGFPTHNRECAGVLGFGPGSPFFAVTAAESGLISLSSEGAADFTITDSGDDTDTPLVEDSNVVPVEAGFAGWTFGAHFVHGYASFGVRVVFDPSESGIVISQSAWNKLSNLVAHAEAGRDRESSGFADDEESSDDDEEENFGLFDGVLDGENVPYIRTPPQCRSSAKLDVVLVVNNMVIMDASQLLHPSSECSDEEPEFNMRVDQDRLHGDNTIVVGTKLFAKFHSIDLLPRETSFIRFHPRDLTDPIRSEFVNLFPTWQAPLFKQGHLEYTRDGSISIQFEPCHHLHDDSTCFLLYSKHGDERDGSGQLSFISTTPVDEDSLPRSPRYITQPKTIYRLSVEYSFGPNGAIINIRADPVHSQGEQSQTIMNTEEGWERMIERLSLTTVSRVGHRAVLVALYKIANI